MIKDVPNAHDLEQIALRLYFGAFNKLCEILEGLGAGFSCSVFVRNGKIVVTEWDVGGLGPTLEESEANVERYLELSQPEFQLLYSMMQHAQEISLKAKICHISPFLLVMNTDLRQFTKRDISFMDLRTLDANDLPAVFDAVYQTPLSENFKKSYEAVRRGRNVIHHLGISHQNIDPIFAIKSMIDHFIELYPDLNFLQTFHRVTSIGWSTLYDVHNFEKGSILHFLSVMTPFLTRHQRNTLIGFGPKEKQYRCQDCVHTSEFDDRSGGIDIVRWKLGEPNAVCRLCEINYEIIARVCKNCGERIAFQHESHGCFCPECWLDPDDTTRLPLTIKV